MNLDACWSPICTVDVAPLQAWLAATDQPWSVVAENKPGRVLAESWPDTVQRAIHAVCSHFDCDCVASRVMLSRMRPGQSHPMHVDNQRSNWITRVHVPITTNPGCWMAFEEEGRWLPDHWERPEVFLPGRTHFAAGHAYTFNAVRRHAFGNDGETDRVHLIFDVLRRDT